MKRIGQLVFLGAVVAALALYWVTAPDGLPWNGSSHLALAYLGEIVRLPVMPHPIWGCYVQVFGGAVVLSVVMASLAAGLLSVLVNRYFGWRFAASAALVWIFLPGVWNRAITGERGICLAAMAVVGAWALDGVVRRVLRKAREVWAARRATAAVAEGDGLGVPSAHEAVVKRGKVNRIAGWAAMGAAGLFAVVSLTFHDYRYGEAASVFARGVAEEAGERVIVLNGACDDQVLREARGKVRAEGPLTSDLGLSCIFLRNDDAYRTNLFALVRSAFPTETNLWAAARVGAAAFAEAAVKSHPERFYLMSGKSTTPDAWERRWEAFKPYLASRDPFVRVARRMFGYEGNSIANAMLDEKDKVGGQGQERNLTSGARSALTSGEGLSALPSTKERDHRSSTFDFDSSQAAWQLYKRIYTEVDSGNLSALVNMNEMIRRGHAASGDEKKWLAEALEKFFKDAFNRQHAREIVRASGPVRVDPAVLEKMAAEAKRRVAAKVAAGEKVEYAPEILSLLEWNNEMVRLMSKGEIVQAGRIARAILSNPKWQGFVPANAVLGSVAAREGDYASSEAFFKVAMGTTNVVPAVVLNDYADTLIHLGKLDEAERQARRAVKGSDESLWVARLTLAEVLERREKAKAGGPGREGKIDEAALAAFAVGRQVDATSSSRQNKDGTSTDRRDGDVASTEERDRRSSTSTPDFNSPETEIRALLKSVLQHAPAKTCDRIRKEHKGYVR